MKGRKYRETRDGEQGDLLAGTLFGIYLAAMRCW